jgi:HPt (histidine-containing phosphotransfer) domain-containing protein
MTTTSPPPLPQATSQRLRPPALDPVRLCELQALKPAVRSRVVRAYRRDAPMIMSVIERAIEQGDTTGVRDGAHRLKSSSAAIGAYRLAELYGMLESASRHGHGTERAVIAELREELLSVLSGLSTVGEG